MIEVKDKSILPKTKGQIILEHILLVICLCVIAVRTTVTESANLTSTGSMLGLANEIQSLIFTSVILVLVVFWFIQAFLRGGFYYRFTSIEIGLVLFVIAASLGIAVASDKRAAITDFVTKLAPLLMAVLLVQILDSQSKIKLVLIVISALAVASAYRCASEFFVDNQVMIEQYEENPLVLLGPLEIRQGSFNHWLFEHRLYSRGVQGFFTTGNSVGSFSILALFAALGLFLEGFRYYRLNKISLRFLVTTAVAVIIIALNFVFTRSKGAIAALLFALFIFILLFRFGSWIKAHRKTVLSICLLLVVAVGFLVVSYGLKHGRLPGGNSMLVRWQYWVGASQMYADHPIKGVGPGNFGLFYTQYKDPGALESVKDPHNFLLALMTQYGPLGLIGFLALIFIPLSRVLSNSKSFSELRPEEDKRSFRKFSVFVMVLIVIVLLIVRPIIKPMASGGQGLFWTAYAVFVLYLTPVVVFVIGFWLLTNSDKSIKTCFTNITTVALVSACLGVTVHNLIDFAIFEPGIYTTFWALMAVLIVLDCQQKNRRVIVTNMPNFARILVVVLVAYAVFVYFNYAVVPVAKTTKNIRQAHNSELKGQFQIAHSLYERAAENDRFDSTALYFNSQLYKYRFERVDSRQMDLLLKAEKCLLEAVNRNKADFKNYEELTDVYNLLAENSALEERQNWLNKAFAANNHSVLLYPGSDRLNVKLADIAEKLGKTSLALEHYQKAINIEEKYRVQFRTMYPDRGLFSRMGQRRYEAVKKRIERLSEEQTP